MLDEVWGKDFDRLGLRRPLADVEAFAKKYLPRRRSVEVKAAERTERFLDVFDKTILRFDPTYLRRLLDQNLIVSSP